MARCDHKLYLMTAVSVCKRNRSWQHPATAGVLQEVICLGCTHGHVQDTLNHILLSMLHSRWTFYHKNVPIMFTVMTPPLKVLPASVGLSVGWEWIWRICSSLQCEQSSRWLHRRGVSLQRKKRTIKTHEMFLFHMLLLESIYLWDSCRTHSIEWCPVWGLTRSVRHSWTWLERVQPFWLDSGSHPQLLCRSPGRVLVQRGPQAPEHGLTVSGYWAFPLQTNLLINKSE